MSYKVIFELFQKLHHDIIKLIPLSFVLLNLESVERANITKILISQERKAFFIVFDGLSVGEFADKF